MHGRTGKRYILFGDSAFARGPHLQRMLRNVQGNVNMIAYNATMSKIRIAVEWGFGGIKNQFAYVGWARGMRMGAMPVGKIVAVAAFLKNCHNAAYGDLAGSYLGTLGLTQTISLRDYILLGQE